MTYTPEVRARLEAIIARKPFISDGFAADIEAALDKIDVLGSNLVLVRAERERLSTSLEAVAAENERLTARVEEQRELVAALLACAAEKPGEHPDPWYFIKPGFGPQFSEALYRLRALTRPAPTPGEEHTGA